MQDAESPVLSFENPSVVHAPLGLYSHVARVAAGTELIYLSGQLGVRPDGSTPAGIDAQSDQIFSNIVQLAASFGCRPADIVKLTTYIVAGQDGDAVRRARRKYLGDHRPASTAVFVAGLMDPIWFVEVEAVLARAAA